MVRGKEVAASGMDVGFVCQGWPPDVGGVESHAADLARALIARGHRAHVLALDYGEGLEPYSTRDLDPAEHGGVAVRRMAYLYRDQAALHDVVENERANDVVLAWLAETPCDVVHVHHATGFGLGILRAVRDVGQPLVMTLHDYWALCPRGQMLRHDGVVCARPEPEPCGACLLATWPHLFAGGAKPDEAGAAAAERTAHALACLALSHRLFTPSEAARAVYARAGVDPARIQVVANGVDVEGLAAEVAALRAQREPRDEVRLGVLGSVLPSKGVLELAQALERADAPGLVLEVHGNLPSYHGDESYTNGLRALAAREPRVRVRGPYARAELPRILAELDGVAAPSRWEEVFGLTVREAAAAGLPVLVSDAGGLPELAATGAGIVVPRGDAGAWVRALERFANDADARARWGGARPALRTTGEMAAELEHAYVEVVRAVTGHAPAGMETAPAPTRKRGLLGRLFGR
jgi:glycosyltransferase involved in cell wall biosynthesis